MRKTQNVLSINGEKNKFNEFIKFVFSVEQDDVVNEISRILINELYYIKNVVSECMDEYDVLKLDEDFNYDVYEYMIAIKNAYINEKCCRKIEQILNKEKVVGA